MVRRNDPFPIVAIGASAGGLEAFTELLKALQAKTGMGFVLIQHLEPTHESVLTQLLSRATAMPVVQASEGMAVKPDRVYIIPPNKGMTIRDGALRLSERAKGGPHHPIDEFCVALAEERKSAALGILLSGSGSDGTLGLKAIQGCRRHHVCEAGAEIGSSGRSCRKARSRPARRISSCFPAHRGGTGSHRTAPTAAKRKNGIPGRGAGKDLSAPARRYGRGFPPLQAGDGQPQGGAPT